MKPHYLPVLGHLTVKLYVVTLLKCAITDKHELSSDDEISADKAKHFFFLHNIQSKFEATKNKY